LRAADGRLVVEQGATGVWSAKKDPMALEKGDKQGEERENP